MTIWTYDADSAEVRSLAAEYLTIDKQVTELDARQRDIERRVDEIRMEKRPTFPTDAQRAGIVEAIRRIREGEKSESHHGDNCGTPEVTVHTQAGRIMVMHQSPSSVARRGGKLWHFTPEEYAAIQALIAPECVTVTSWAHDNGLSFIVAVKP